MAVFVYHDGEQVGRISYVNNRRPPAQLVALLRELALATGSEDRRLRAYEKAG